MKKNILLLILCLPTLALIGCVSTKIGTDFNTANVNKLKVGKTTEQEVIRLIGQPKDRTRNSNGSVRLFYMYTPGQKIHPFSIFTNPDLIQNAGAGMKMLTVMIGSNGKLKSFSENTTYDSSQNTDSTYCNALLKAAGKC